MLFIAPFIGKAVFLDAGAALLWAGAAAVAAAFEDSADDDIGSVLFAELCKLLNLSRKEPSFAKPPGAAATSPPFPPSKFADFCCSCIARNRSRNEPSLENGTTGLAEDVGRDESEALEFSALFDVLFEVSEVVALVGVPDVEVQGGCKEFDVGSDTLGTEDSDSSPGEGNRVPLGGAPVGGGPPGTGILG